MDSNELNKRLSCFFAANAEKRHIDLAFLYGSWAADRQRADSDVDIAVLFSDEANCGKDLYQTIADIGMELSLVIGREVNLIVLRWDFDKPMLYYNAVVHGVPLYIGNKGFYDRYMLEAVSQMEDFCIFGVMWQIAAARRNLKGVANA